MSRPPEPQPEAWQPLLFVDLDVFRQARHLLQQAGLLRRANDPGAGDAGLVLMLAGLERPGQVWVARDRLDDAMRLLDEHGIPAALPAVDRTEAICPVCGSALPPGDATSCPACAARFDWMDSGATPPDPDDALAARLPRGPMVAALGSLALAVVLAGSGLPWSTAVATVLTVLGLMILVLVAIFRLR